MKIPDPLLPTNNFRSRLRWMKRLAPVSLFALVVFYELVPSRWIHERIGEPYHYLAEILFYGILGPVLAYLAFVMLEHWLEERETSELQARIVSQRQAELDESLKLNDDALQALFATSIILASQGTDGRDPQSQEQTQAAKKMIDCTIQRLRDHLTVRSAAGPRL